MKYNGYTNYPTWCVSLYLNQDYYRNEVIPDLADNLDGDVNIDLLVEVMKDEFYEEMHDIKLAGPFSDLLTWAEELVNWHEIAELLVEE